MKKSRIISVALTLALVLTTVFAGTESIFLQTPLEPLVARLQQAYPHLPSMKTVLLRLPI